MNLNSFRAIVLVSLITALSAQIFIAWGDMHAVGLAFVRVLTVTTAAGIILGIFFQERAWCHISPMGTLGNWTSENKRPLQVSEQCKGCKICARVCPMQLKPYEYKAGAMQNHDCLKCGSGVTACPINALGFEQKGVPRAA